MDNQHKQIKGYRDLSQTEIDLMNEGKTLAERCGAYVAKLRCYNESNFEASGLLIDQRWVSIGATDLQCGFMEIARGITQPTTF